MVLLREKQFEVLKRHQIPVMTLSLSVEGLKFFKFRLLWQTQGTYQENLRRIPNAVFCFPRLSSGF